MKCRKCGSENIKIVECQGTNCTVCKDCGFDERNELDVFPEEKVSQKAKAQHSPYKTGGPKRTN